MSYNFNMEITKATPKDTDTILALQAQIYRVENLAPNSREFLKKQLADSSCDILVTRDKERVVATATIYYIEVAARARPYALLEGLVVDKNQRGHGIGTAFFKKCIEIAKSKNCYKMIFTSGKDRPEAHKFYENLGFEKWGLEFRKDL